jgi:hypothetical protein
MIKNVTMLFAVLIVLFSISTANAADSAKCDPNDLLCKNTVLNRAQNYTQSSAAKTEDKHHRHYHHHRSFRHHSFRHRSICRRHGRG